MRERDMTRRALIGGSLVLSAAACRPLGFAPPEPDPALASIRRAIAAEQALLDRYEAVRGQHPQLAGHLDALSADHQDHLRALRARVDPPLSSPSAGRAQPRPSAAETVPANATHARRQLARDERKAADARLRDLESAPAFVAQLLASIGASEASHAALLAPGRPRARGNQGTDDEQRIHRPR